MVTEFDKYLDASNWKTMNEHFTSFSSSLDQNIDIAIQKDRTAELRQWMEDNLVIKREDVLIQEKVKADLMSGQVVGVDGTCADCDLIAGFQARIAIVAVNYKNNRAEYVSYISEPFIDYAIESVKGALEFLRKKGTGQQGLTSAHIRAIMLFKERDFALSRPEKFKMVQGDILPYELRTGQGRLRGLRSCLSLGRKLLNEQNIVAVQATTNKQELRWIGNALKPGEYVKLYDYARLLDAYLHGDDFTQPAHFNDEDTRMFDEFNEEVRTKFSVGVYKAKNRAYVFYAPTTNFDLLANLILLDSRFQPLRGFPLLLDYADIICSKLFAAGDFGRTIEFKLAKKKVLESEANERSLRRR
jgi:hypothetical protein